MKLIYLSVIVIDLNTKNILWKPAYEESLGVLILFFLVGQLGFAILCYAASGIGIILLDSFIATIGGEPMDLNSTPDVLDSWKDYLIGLVMVGFLVYFLAFNAIALQWIFLAWFVIFICAIIHKRMK